MKRFVVVLEQEVFRALVALMRRRSIRDLSTLYRNKRFLSKPVQQAVVTVYLERRHRMGGN